MIEVIAPPLGAALRGMISEYSTVPSWRCTTSEMLVASTTTVARQVPVIEAVDRSTAPVVTPEKFAPTKRCGCRVVSPTPTPTKLGSDALTPSLLPPKLTPTYCAPPKLPTLVISAVTFTVSPTATAKDLPAATGLPPLIPYSRLLDTCTPVAVQPVRLAQSWVSSVAVRYSFTRGGTANW